MRSSSKGYSLIDSGNGQKLEQFGSYLLIRPEPAASWNSTLPFSKWEATAHARFVPKKSPSSGINRGGIWQHIKPIPEEWIVQFEVAQKKFRFRIAPSPFGHVALFPEQWENWKFIAERLQKMKVSAPKVLNLFAYTGAASVVARAFGADVVHVDSSRPILNQARQNMELNHLEDIRWVFEDAFKFARREAKRGRTYQGIILDPPPAGHGPSGEKWTIDSMLQPILSHCRDILATQDSFLIMSLYAQGWPPEEGAHRLSEIFPHDKVSANDLVLVPAMGNSKLDQGTYARLVR